MLKPMLARGQIQTIGATTIEEYRLHVERDAAFERRFQPVHVSVPDVATSVEILHGLRPRYEAHHGVTIADVVSLDGHPRHQAPAVRRGAPRRDGAAPAAARGRPGCSGAGVSVALRDALSGLGDPGRPIGSFLFLGSTGVGKTLLARALAEF